MPTFTLGRAAKLYGLHRSTLYAAINRGALSVSLNGKGQKVVDLSEMLRVFGEPAGAAQQFDTLSDTCPNSRFDTISSTSATGAGSYIAAGGAEAPTRRAAGDQG